MRSCKRGEYPVSRLMLDRATCKTSETRSVRTPKDAADLVRAHYAGMPQEAALVVVLSSNNSVLNVVEIGLGALDSVPVDPRLVFGACITVGGTAFVFCHNHPSGNNQPSDSDLRMTRQLQDGAKLVGLHMLDHVIVTRNGYYSFQEHGNL